MQPLPPQGLGCPDSSLSCAQGGPEALHQHPLPSLPAAPGLLLLWVVWTFYEASGLSTGLMSPEIGSHFRVLTMESHSGNSNRTPGIFVRTPGLASVSLETLRGPPKEEWRGAVAGSAECWRAASGGFPRPRTPILFCSRGLNSGPTLSALLRHNHTESRPACLPGFLSWLLLLGGMDVSLTQGQGSFLCLGGEMLG